MSNNPQSEEDKVRRDIAQANRRVADVLSFPNPCDRLMRLLRLYDESSFYNRRLIFQALAGEVIPLQEIKKGGGSE